MTDLALALFVTAIDWVQFLAIQGTIVLVVVLSLTWFARKLRPATRHTVMLSSIVSLFAAYVATRSAPVQIVEEETRSMSQHADPNLLARYPLIDPAAFNRTVEIDIKPDGTKQKIVRFEADGVNAIPPQHDPRNFSHNGIDSPEHSQSDHSFAGWFKAFDFVDLFTVCFLGGAAYFSLQLLFGFIASRSIVRKTRPVLRHEVPVAIYDLAGRFTELRIHQTQQIMPYVYGVFRKRIILPTDFLERSELQQHTIVAHEAAHAKRWDTFVNLAMSMAKIFMWVHPLFWIINHKLKMDAEKAADELAVNSSDGPITYAESLLEIVKGLVPPRQVIKPASAYFAAQGSLESRIKHILGTNQSGGKRNFLRCQMIGGVFGISMFALSVICSTHFRAGSDTRSYLESDNPTGFVSYQVEEEYSIIE